MDISVSLKTEGAKRTKPDTEAELGFGRYFSDHMFLLDYDHESGWANPRIEPYGPISLEPAASVFHYAQEVFDNHKIFRRPGGELALFRVNDYLDRLANSAERMCIPTSPRELHLRALKKLLLIDRAWAPSAPMTALNVRHAIIATEPFLGVRPSKKYCLFIITGPVGAYYSEGLAPVNILVEEKYVRAAPGGVGQAKTGGNYAASLKAQMDAQARGYAQVLWLDAKERSYIEEVGAMNIFFKFKDELVTPPLTGTILPGVTRDSIITLAKSLGQNVVERPVTIEEVVQASDSGDLEEIFGTGTAAVVSSVACLGYRGRKVVPANGRPGPLTHKLMKSLTEIQSGLAPDPYGWVEILN
jgi:branched-chain amino acid aminotransferase